MPKKTKARGEPTGSRVTVKKIVARKARLLTRKNLCKLEDTGETHADIQRELEAAGGAQALKGKLSLSRDSIVVAESVFQWRRPDEDVADREAHIVDMANAVVDGGKPLEAILVFPVGAKFYLVDGHHRLAAYDTAHWGGAIPATAFSGTLEEAYLEALKCNSRNKLPMTQADKMEAAWRLVKLGWGRVRVNDYTGASTSNVSIMKAKLRKLKDGGRTTEEIGAMTWVQARNDWKREEGEFDAEDWKERKANKLVDALMKANIGFMLREQPEITAIALAKIDGSLPGALMHEWFHDAENEALIAAFIESRMGDPEMAAAWGSPVKF